MRRAWLVFILAAMAACMALLYASARPVAYDDADAQTLRLANQLLEGGQTADAIALYEQLVEQGVVEATLFYNLGRAHYDGGDVGRALYAFLRAQAAAPRADDVDTNVRVLRAQVGRRPTAGGLPDRILDTVEGTLTFNETAAIALGCWLAMAVVLLVVRALRPGYLRRLGTFALVALAVLTVAGAVLFGRRLYERTAEPLAVVLDRQVVISPEPGGAAASGLTLPGGAELRVLERRDGWFRVVVAGTRSQGWVPAQSVGIVS